MKHIQKYHLFESNSDEGDLLEVKEILNDWFQSYTDDIFEISIGRILFMNPDEECPECKSDSLIDLGYDYDSGQSLVQCSDCEHVGSKSDFNRDEVELHLLPYSAYDKDAMNCLNIRDTETGQFLLHHITDKQTKHLNSLIEPLGYTYLEFGKSKRNFQSTITSIDTIEKIKKKFSENESTQYFLTYLGIEEGLNESRLIMSNQMREFINSHSRLWVSRKLLNLEFDEQATDTINFLQPSGEDKITFSDDKKFLGKDEETFDWEAQPHHNAANVGRVIRKILVQKRIEFDDKDIEDFVNYWKSHFLPEGKLKVEIVSGDKIQYWYHKKNYHPLSDKSTLGKSCMAYTKCQPFLDIYTKNPEVCQMIIMLDSEDKLVARALLWTDKLGEKLVDRIYYMNQSIENKMVKWIRKNIPNASIYGEDFYQGGAPKKFVIQLKEWKFKKYPYLDSFNKLNWKNGELAAQDIWFGPPVIALWYTDGDSRLISIGYVYSEHLNDFLDKSAAYWDNDLRSWMPLKGWEKVKSKIKNWMNF